MRAVSKLPAVVLVLVLAVLPIQAWLAAGRSDVRVDRPLDDLRGITWAGTVRADGDVAVTITYRFGTHNADPREVSVRLPDGARLLTVDGKPADAGSGKYGEVVTSGETMTVGYEVSGRVTRYADGVIVDFAGLANLSDGEAISQAGSFDPDTNESDQALFPCARCYLNAEGYGHTALYGALYAEGLDGSRLAVGGVDQLHVEDEGGALRFVAKLDGADDANLVAVLPLSAAPDAPTPADRRTVLTADGTVAGAEFEIDAATAREAYDALRDRAERAGVPMGEASSGAPIGKVATAVILSAMWVALVAWIAWRIAAARRALAADRPDAPIVGGAAFSPPSGLAPELVAVVVGDTGGGKRSAVAATLLALAHRGVIRIDGLDSRRYTLTVPPGAQGSTPFEEAVLAELRPQGQITSTATFNGPPLWGAGKETISGRLSRLAVKQAYKARILRVTLAMAVLLPASVAMGVVALVGSGGTSVLAWIVALAGPVVGFLAARLTGANLTARGRAERDNWLQYGAWLRSNSQLHEVGAPGVVVWGEALVYAAVLGAAPVAAADLGLA